MGFAVIFDMDGVLINTVSYFWPVFGQILEPYGIQLDDSDLKKYNGISLQDILLDWNRKFGISLTLPEFTAKANEMEFTNIKNGLHIESHVVSLLKELKENNIPLAVGSSSQKERVERLLGHFNISSYFSAFSTASDVQNHKPHPDIFLSAAEKLGVPAKNCIVVEDSPSGIEAAKRGGMKSVGLVTKYHSPDELSEADILVNSLSELSYQRIKNMF